MARTNSITTLSEAIEAAQLLLGPEAVAEDIGQIPPVSVSPGRYVIGLTSDFVMPDGTLTQGVTLLSWSNVSWDDAFAWLRENKSTFIQGS